MRLVGAVGDALEREVGLPGEGRRELQHELALALAEADPGDREAVREGGPGLGDVDALVEEDGDLEPAREHLGAQHLRRPALAHGHLAAELPAAALRRHAVRAGLREAVRRAGARRGAVPEVEAPAVRGLVRIGVERDLVGGLAVQAPELVAGDEHVREAVDLLAEREAHRRADHLEALRVERRDEDVEVDVEVAVLPVRRRERQEALVRRRHRVVDVAASLRQHVGVARDHVRRRPVQEIELADRPARVGDPVAEAAVGREVRLATREARAPRDRAVRLVVDRERRHAVRRVRVRRVHEERELRLGVRDEHLLLARHDVELPRRDVGREVDELARVHPERRAALLVGARVRDEHAVLDDAAVLEPRQVERRLHALGKHVEVVVGSRQAQVDDVTPVGRDVRRDVVAARLVGRELALGTAVERTHPDAPLPVPPRLPRDETVAERGERGVVGLPALGRVGALRHAELRNARLRGGVGRIARRQQDQRQRGAGGDETLHP